MDVAFSVAGEVKEDIVRRLYRAIDKAKEKGDLPGYVQADVRLTVPPRQEQGDLATGVAMSVASQIKSDGRSVAGILVKHLAIDDSHIARIDIAGPGFLNFFLDTAWLQSAMARIWADGPLYGRTPRFGGKKVLLEFVSANPTGPLNVVNARAAAVGDCLASMLEMAGCEVTREFYVNDAGGQISMLAASLWARYLGALGKDASVPEGGYRGDYLKDLARTLVDEHGSDLLDMEQGERDSFLKEWAVAEILKGQKKTLADYGVKFDRWFSEKSLREEGAHTKVVDILTEKGLTYEKDGALWFKSTQFGDDKDRVLVKSDAASSTTYMVPDLAYHKNKMERGTDLMINILGPDHHGYLQRLGAGLLGLGFPEGCLEVLLVQTVRLTRGKEVVKMSKRGGEFFSMDELLEEVGKDAARFFFLMRSPESHLDFDMDLARLQSNENPVFYVQYAHARIASIFRQARQEGFSGPVGPNEIKFSLLKDPQELALMKILAVFPDHVYEIALARAPNRLVSYMTDVATAFHAFYTRCRVLSDDKQLSGARLYLARLTQIVLANALRLAGISAPEIM